MIGRSLQTRLALWIGLGVSLLWLGGAVVSTQLTRHHMARASDAALAATAQRLLPILADRPARRRGGDALRIPQLRRPAVRALPRAKPLVEAERYSYVVRDAEGRVVLQSFNAEAEDFPDFRGRGFRRTSTHILFQEQNPRTGQTITVAEPRAARTALARDMLMTMVWPLVALVPLAFAIIWGVLRRSLRPVQALGQQIAARGSRDLSPLTPGELPTELAPMAEAVDDLLARLRQAFEAERSFAANAAHELRTPIAAALAQVQRLRAQVTDPDLQTRADDVAGALRRLTRLSEKLMQMARAEGGRLHRDTPADLRPVAQMVVADLERSYGRTVHVDLSGGAVMSRIDPDIFGILLANLLENALRHGAPGGDVAVMLRDDMLRVRNDGPAQPDAHALTDRFARGDGAPQGAGLGLSIVQAIVTGLQADLTLSSPIDGRDDGFEATIRAFG